MASTIIAYKYRIYPTKAQQAKLDWTLSQCRFLYNCALEQRKDAYKRFGVSVSYHEQAVSLPELKEQLPEYSDVYSQVLQDVLKRLDKAYQAFFNRAKRGDKVGHPRFKGKDRFDSFTYPQYKQVPTKTVYLPKIGNVVIKLSRAIEGKIKTCTVKREANQWYVVFTAEHEPKKLDPTGNTIGLDFGLTDIVATSEGELVAAPKPFKHAQRKLRVAQRSLSRKRKGSKNREKAKLKVAKLHQKVKRQRADFLHKLSTRLIKENDTIVIEDLSLKGLSRGMLAKSFNDAGIGYLVAMLTYKAENAGRQLIKVAPQYTSQDCPACGKRQKKELSERWHSCECGCEGHRDVIAAQVIRGRADPLLHNVEVVGSSVQQESPRF